MKWRTQGWFIPGYIRPSSFLHFLIISKSTSANFKNVSVLQDDLRKQKKNWFLFTGEIQPAQCEFGYKGYYPSMGSWGKNIIALRQISWKVVLMKTGNLQWFLLAICLSKPNNPSSWHFRLILIWHGGMFHQKHLMKIWIALKWYGNTFCRIVGMDFSISVQHEIVKH